VTPLPELGSAEYLGFTGGLYPDAKNSPPAPHEQTGVAVGASVRPVESDGSPSPSGKVVFLSIGFSNASREFSQFIRLVDGDKRKNCSLVTIDAARNGADATLIADRCGEYWTDVERQLQRHGATGAQVQIVWLKTALARKSGAFPQTAQALQRELCSIVGILGVKFPQLKQVYVSSRVFGGYSETDLSPEPIAYESGFAVKWLIEESISCPKTTTPWVSWGPYLWADGLTPRSDGLLWERADFEADGVHPSAQGTMKVARKLLEFFESSPSARPWLLSQPQ
jgi:hypothetical protein